MYKLLRPLVSPTTGLPSFNSAPDHPLDFLPEDWVAKNSGHIKVYEFIHYIGANGWILIQSAFESPESVKALKNFFPEDKKPLHKSGLTVEQWLLSLNETVQQLMPSDTRLNALSVSIEEFFGPFKHVIQHGRSMSSMLNDTHFAALFSYYNYVEYDDRVCCFYLYAPTEGIWHAVSEQRVLKLLIDFVAVFSRAEPLAFSQTIRFYGQILSIIKATNLHNLIAFPGRQVLCMKDNCLLLDSEAPESVEQVGHSAYFGLRNTIPVNTPKKIPTKGGAVYAKKFDAFLRSMMHVDDIDLLQFWCGLVLLGRNPYHKILLLTGTGGAGKSTLLNILEAILGPDNIASFSTDRLEERFELSAFFGKTLLVAKDVASDFLARRSAHVLKSLSGDTGIKAEVKHVQARVTLGGPFNIVMTSNADLLLEMHGDADAWLRRLWVVPITLDKSVPRIPNYEKELLAKEGSDIFGWMVAGAIRVLTHLKKGTAYELTPLQNKNVTRLLSRSNPLEEFVKTCVKRSPHTFVGTHELYDAYCLFCSRQGIDSIDETVFRKRVGKLISGLHKGVGPTNSKTKPPFKGYENIELIP